MGKNEKQGDDTGTGVGSVRGIEAGAGGRTRSKATATRQDLKTASSLEAINTIIRERQALHNTFSNECLNHDKRL